MEDRDCCSGLTIAQCHPMLEIDEMGSTNLRDLASMMNLDKSTLSRTIEGLVRRGLVKRKSDTRDRRYVFLSLTTKGQKICDDINARNDRFYDLILRRLPMAHQGNGIRFFEDLVRALAEAISPRERFSEK